LSIKPIQRCRPVHTVPERGGPSTETGDIFYCALLHEPRTSGHFGEVKGRGRSNMAATNCARENVLQDKDTRFVNTKALSRLQKTPLKKSSFFCRALPEPIGGITTMAPGNLWRK